MNCDDYSYVMIELSEKSERIWRLKISRIRSFFLHFFTLFLKYRINKKSFKKKTHKKDDEEIEVCALIHGINHKKRKEKKRENRERIERECWKLGKP